MRVTRCISLILLACALMAGAGDADAAPTYIWGSWWEDAAPCPGGGVLPNTRTYAGYTVDPGPLQTGDTGEVVGFATNVGCVLDGVSMKFYLPPGAQLAVTAARPVSCIIFDGVSETLLPAAQCAQAPVPDASGGLMVAAAYLRPGWWLRVEVPVRYERELAASAGDRLRVMMQTSWGGMQPVVPMNVAYRAQLMNPTASATTTTATIGYALFTYLRGGTLTFDWGTSAAFGNSDAGTVPPGYVSFSNPSDSLSALQPNTQYYWRARFVADNGFTVTSPTHSFVTASAAPVPLSVIVNGTGRGTVTSTPAGIQCSSGSAVGCSTSVAPGTMVRLVATPASPGQYFAGWGGACTGVDVCSVTVNNAASVTATFNYFTGGTPLPGPPPPPRR